MRLSHRRVRTRIGVAIAACLLLVGAVGERQARAQLTPSDVLSIVDAIKGAYSAYTDFRSLVDGTDVSTATLINNARDAIISEMHGIVETSVEDDIEASIRDWLEVTQTLQAFPQNNNSIMLGRVSGLLDGTQLDWVTLKNIILTSNDLTLVKKALPAFNTVTALRVTMMKALAQFNPPMPVPQDTIDQVVIDALQVDYAAIGARIASYSGNPRDPNPVAHLHQSGLVAAKRLYPMFFSSQAVYSCSGTCTPYLTHFSGNGAGGVCNTAHHGTATTCHGSDCGTTDNLCGDVRNVQNGCPGGPEFPDGFTFWFVVPDHSCDVSAGISTYDLMTPDATVSIVREAMRAIVLLGQTGPATSWQPKFYTVVDSVFIPANPYGSTAYLLPIPGQPSQI